MIITRLIGGLGNQLFQYAAGKSLAMKLGVELKLDLSCFQYIPDRQYDLYPFNIKENVATEEEVHKLTYRKVHLPEKIINKLLSRTAKPPRSFISETVSHFDSKILSLPDNTYLNGYWQTEKYFSSIETTIRQEYSFKDKPDSMNELMLEKIGQDNSVSLHIRRGDYITSPVASTHHGVCSLEYYQKAVERIQEANPSLHIFVFSDDITWAKENLKFEHKMTFADHNLGNKHYEDLRLMSHCQHHILANSTFSWWGAWLNTNPNKIVIAPKKWFQISDRNTTDLIPADWIQL